jgi:ATP-binding cassette subfamily B protein
MILEKALTLELRHFEDPEFYDQLTRARREASSRPISVVSETFQLFQNSLTLLGYAALLIRFSGVAVIGLVLAAIPATISEMRFSHAAFRLRNWRSPESKAQLPRVRSGERRPRQGGEALRRRKDAARSLPVDGRRVLQGGPEARREARGWGFGLSLIATSAYYGCYVVVALVAPAAR